MLSLQNGSDIRGTALKIDGGADVNLTSDAVNRIATAFAGWLASTLKKDVATLKIGVGTDSRVTADNIKREIFGAVAVSGASAYDCGLASTPAMFMGTVFDSTGYDGTIMVTASHLPMERNGLKFFTKAGGLDKGDITAILEAATKAEYSFKDSNAEKAPLMELYAEYLRGKIVDGVGDAQPLKGLHIVVDAGNGAGGFFVDKVLKPLGADCSGSQFLEPDGTFPNHIPNPENKAAMQAICDAVINSKADLGFIFDTDVDRMSAVLEGGTEINRNLIIALTAAILAPEYPGSTIVTDSITSDRLTAFLENKLGLHHHCFKRGYKNVINEAIRLNNEGTITPLAIETSGHGALKENYFLDDGAYLAVRVIIAAAKAVKNGKTLTSLLDGYSQAQFEQEYRFPILAKDFQSYGKSVLEQFKQRASDKGIAVIPSFEGIRISFGETGWAIIRLSLHDPIIPLNVESDTEDGIKEILAAVAELLDGLDQLDTSVIK